MQKILSVAASSRFIFEQIEQNNGVGGDTEKQRVHGKGDKQNTEKGKDR